jgi:hypothetical protein
VAKNQNTFAKRQREAEKRRKADDKRVRRQLRKDGVRTERPSDADPGVATGQDE